MKKIKTIQLKNVGHKWREMLAFGEQLISNLGDDIFTFKNKTELLYYVLKQIHPVNRSLKPEEVSIEKACEKIIRNFRLDREATISSLTDDGWKEIKSEKKSYTDKFCEEVIVVDKNPAPIYKSLLSQVNKDLHVISELIKWYETQSCIQKYIKTNETPKRHEERIIYDFYKRCIAERVEIFNYQMYGVKQRALQKSKYAPKWLKSIQAFSQMYSDRPYHFAYPFSIHYFDCQMIDLSGHRVGEFYIDEARKIQQLYSDNKTAFYRRYFKRIPILQHFQNFKFYLPYLPLSNNRDLIFDELIKLFKARRWISFYALALPQVEGLFSEMCQAAFPEKDLSQKSLSHKVDSVRDLHSMGSSYFDYYQYHIPRQRNRFSHTGYDEDFKLKSYDLLVDLSHLLKIFYELDNPLVKVKKLHVRKNYEDFISIKEFTDYFKLLNSLKAQQKKDLKGDIEKFEKEFLMQSCSVDYTCYQLMQELPNIIKEFTEYLDSRLNILGDKMDFDKLKITDIKALLEDEKQLEIITDSFDYKPDLIETLDDYSTFIFSYKKHLPSLPNEIKQEFEKLEIDYKLFLEKFKYISKCINEN